MSAYSFILKSGRSGPFSWTRSACESASFMLVVKLRRSRDAPGDKPTFSSAGHASSTYWRRAASAFGAGSVAITSNPRARYCAAQLAPMTPVPTIAIRCIALSKDISASLLRFVFQWCDFVATQDAALFAQLSQHAIHYRCFNGGESIWIGSEVLSGF